MAELAIGVEFDDGDFVALGELSRHGLNPIKPTRRRKDT